MSYSSFVVCRCYQDGKTSVPPFPELVVLDEDGLSLDIPETDLHTDEDWALYFEKQNQFDEWKHTACPHEAMEYAEAWLANGMGMAGFKSYLYSQGGMEVFPVLLKELPSANGGCMPASQAEKALHELHYLKGLKVPMEKIVLREKESKNVIMIGDYEDTIPFAFFDLNKKMILDNRGFFIVETKEVDGVENDYILFQAMEFSTVVVEEKRIAYCDHHAKSLRIGSYFPMQLGENKPLETETAYEVVKEIYQSDSYWNYIVEALEKICKAAVETQNPVHWC